MRRLAFFDLDDTLVDRSRGFRSCVRAFCTDLGFAEDVEQWLLEAMYERAYRDDFERLRERFAVTVPVMDLWQRYAWGMADAVTCDPRVQSGLERLRDSGWLVGVVTNGAGDIQRVKLARTGLDRRVDAVCISEEAGCRKPGVGIFREAFRLVGADRRLGGWMIGDSAQNDVAGGRAAGLQTIWVSDGAEGVVEADHAVSEAADAIALLLNLEEASA